MMSNILPIENYTPFQGDKFLFDANIWMYLYGSIGGYKEKQIRKYADFFKKIIQSKASIIITSLVLSEFINTYIRVEFNSLKTNNPVKYQEFKKDFRNTEKYNELITEIKTIVISKILKISKKICDRFDNIDINDSFFENRKFDFNDKYYQKLANIENLKLVTNDGDFSFANSNITILTANEKLLNITL